MARFLVGVLCGFGFIASIRRSTLVSRSGFSSLALDFAMFPIPRELHELYFGALGRIVTGWSQIEFVFHLMADTIHQTAKAGRVEPEVPKLFSKTATYLKLSFNRLPHLDQFKAEGIKVVGAAKHLNKYRQYFIHGYLESFDGATQTAVFVKLDHGESKETYAEARMRLTFSQLLQAGSHATRVAGRAVDLAQGMVDTLVPEHKAHDLSRRL